MLLEKLSVVHGCPVDGTAISLLSFLSNAQCVPPQCISTFNATACPCRCCWAMAMATPHLAKAVPSPDPAAGEVPTAFASVRPKWSCWIFYGRTFFAVGILGEASYLIYSAMHFFIGLQSPSSSRFFLPQRAWFADFPPTLSSSQYTELLKSFSVHSPIVYPLLWIIFEFTLFLKKKKR